VNTCFDEDYLKALQACDPDAERRLVSTFTGRVQAKARRRLRSQEMADDVAQETLFRVLSYFRAGKTLNKPASLPRFIASISVNVSLEMLRELARHGKTAVKLSDPVDENTDPERSFLSEESKGIVRAALSSLEAQDQYLIRRAYLAGADRDQLCRELCISREYLRVLLFRAKGRFKAAVEQRSVRKLFVVKDSALPAAA
jgi:RNA polymerase sigma-70 factor, ECF subfamily